MIKKVIKYIHPFFFSPIHTPGNWGPFPPSDADYIFECLGEIQKEDKIKNKIKQECRGNPEQQSIKKIGGKCKSSIPVRTRIGCGSSRRWGGPDSYTTKDHDIKMKMHTIEPQQKTVTGKLIPRRYVIYKVFNNTLFHVGMAGSYFGRWERWEGRLDNSCASDNYELKKLYERAWKEDHRNFLFDGFYYKHLTISSAGQQQCMYILDTGQSCLQDEFDAVHENAFNILREKYHVEKVGIDDLREMCINYYEPPEKTEMVTLDDDVSRHFDMDDKDNMINIADRYRKYARKMEVEDSEVQNKKITDWPELIVSMAAKIESNEKMPVEAIYVGKGIINRLWRNRKNLQKTTDYTWHPAIWIGSLTEGATNYKRKYVGKIHGFSIYGSETLKDNETMVASGVNRAWRGEVYYAEFSLNI